NCRSYIHLPHLSASVCLRRRLVPWGGTAMRATAVLLALLFVLTGAAVRVVSAGTVAQKAGNGAVFPLDAFGPSPDDNAALKWSEQTLTEIRAATLPPTAVSRVLAIVQTSVYDAWAAYDGVAVGTRL